MHLLVMSLIGQNYIVGGGRTIAMQDSDIRD